MRPQGPSHPLTSVLALVLLLTGGCASYHLGPTSGLEAGAQSITIHPFPNQTPEPRLAPALAGALREQIQSDDTFVLNTRNEGDLVMSGNIIDYRRIGLTFQPNDIITIRDFEIQMTAEVRVVNRRTGDLVMEQNVTGRTLIRAFDDLASAERQALPLLSEDLARRAVDLLVDGDW